MVDSIAVVVVLPGCIGRLIGSPLKGNVTSGSKGDNSAELSATCKVLSVALLECSRDTDSNNLTRLSGTFDRQSSRSFRIDG